MNGGSRRASDSRQVSLLTRTFLLRFFENEITTSTDDLKASFFWLLSFLAAPGLLLPFALLSQVELIAQLRGVDALREMSLGIKAFYLAMSLTSAATVVAIVWRSLLIDRRDAVVLGALPVRGRVVISAKLLALAVYMGLVIVATHAASSVAFGLVLASHNTFGFALRGIVAHFLAPSMAGLFVFALAVAVQGASLTVLGPRVFARLSGWMQLAMVGAIVLGLLALPIIGSSTMQALKWSGEGMRPWVLSTPPLWFLGVYEVILGTDDRLVHELARTALAATGIAVTLAIASFPIAYRRVMTDAIEHPGGFGRVGRASLISWWLVPAIARDGVARATVQFVLATLARVEHHRFTMAIAAGAALAWGLPAVILYQMDPGPGSAGPRVGILALPFSATILLLAGVRMAASVPAEERSAWVFDAAEPSVRSIRSGFRRLMWAAIAIPVLLLALPVVWRLWGAAVAIQHLLVVTATAGAAIEYFSRDVDAMPCTRPWRIDAAHLRAWWAAYLLVFVLVAGVSRLSIPTLARNAFGHPVWLATLLAALVALAAWFRRSADGRPALVWSDEELVGADVTQLHLS